MSQVIVGYLTHPAPSPLRNSDVHTHLRLFLDKPTHELDALRVVEYNHFNATRAQELLFPHKVAVLANY